MNMIATKIYAADVTELENEHWYKAAYQTVTHERQQKTDTFRDGRDRQLSLGAELLLIHGLERIGMDLSEMSYYYGDHGKPYLKGGQDIYFNLSHSEEMVICAISSREIGCDIEKISAVNLNIAKRFFHSSEYERIVDQETEGSKRDMFFRLWTLKESFIKMTGLGMRLPMNSFCIHLNVDGITVQQKENHRTCYFQEFHLGGNYKCSICGFDSQIGSNGGVPMEILKFSDILTRDGGN